ncbi:hypothetical protein AQULUS_21600 [Aquicella lusitana]|uniref:Uncharacterized protein n=1 Tax=Aquicella lusitana TaxID=254246 RepID=A0A370GG59_9COXI|nr:hypothetical protein C8D86_11653 [Aquicella lusitana]VVC74394.1 hypothetical protein AQULUS_21600 [Aquicella lusitana]
MAGNVDYRPLCLDDRAWMQIINATAFQAYAGIHSLLTKIHNPQFYNIFGALIV